MQKNKIDFIHCFKDAFLAGLLALLIFIPIRGMIIDGWELNFQFFYPFLFSGIIFIVRYQIKPINQLLKKIFRQKILDVVVESGKKSHTTALLITAIFVMALIFPFVASKYWIAVMTLAFIYILLGLGLNIVVGMAGMLDLGFVAFYAVGAYSLGLLHQYLEATKGKIKAITKIAVMSKAVVWLFFYHFLQQHLVFFWRNIFFK